MANDKLERVARAMFEDSVFNSIRWETATDELKEQFRKPARAAIAAYGAEAGERERVLVAVIKRYWKAVLDGRNARSAFEYSDGSFADYERAEAELEAAENALDAALNGEGEVG